MVGVDFAFDLEQRTHSTDSPRDENLDILAHADPGDLLPWDDLLHITTMDFQRIDLRPVHRVKLGFRLGAERALSKRNFFYAQSGALCHWLWHAEDGKYRQALLDFVLAYYQGDDTRLDLAANLAMSADRIGAEVGKYAALRRP